LTDATIDDVTTGIRLVAATVGDVRSVRADAAYDTVGFYDVAAARGATVVVPPTSTANISRHGPRSIGRDRTSSTIKKVGRRRWKKLSGYHQQARVENAFFRYKPIIGIGLRARSRPGQERETLLACNILNRMIELGPPASYRIDS
jgi:hypothetical protein